MGIENSINLEELIQTAFWWRQMKRKLAGMLMKIFDKPLNSSQHATFFNVTIPKPRFISGSIFLIGSKSFSSHFEV